MNGRIVPLTYRLRSGDRVEILTAKEANPHRDWLLRANGFLASRRSRDKVRAWFNKIERARNVQVGKESLDRELKRVGQQYVDLSPIARRFHADSVDDLYVQIALGNIGPNQVSRALLETERVVAFAPLARPSKKRHGLSKSMFIVQGVSNILVQLARCCQPVCGEPIAGYLTLSRGVTVHRADCAVLMRLNAMHPQRVLSVEWGSQLSGSYEVEILVRAVNRRWLLKDIADVIAQEDAHMLEMSSDAFRDNGYLQFRVRLRLSHHRQLAALLGKLDGLSGVNEVRRMG